MNTHYAGCWMSDTRVILELQRRGYVLHVSCRYLPGLGSGLVLQAVCCGLFFCGLWAG